MSDRSPDTQDIPNEAKPGDEINPSRRKLTGAALGVSAVFTLASRPVWANQCSISGMASGNLSAPKGPPCGGHTPGYWKTCQHLDSWVATGFKPSDTFNSVFGVTQYVDCSGKPYTLLDVLYLNGGSYSCGPGPKSNQPAHTSVDPSHTCKSGNIYSKDMGGDPVSVNLGFHAVAALLSAAHPGINYGYTSGELTALFRNNLHRAAELKNSLAMLNERGCPLN